MDKGRIGLNEGMLASVLAGCLFVSLTSCAIRPEPKEAWVDLPKPRLLAAPKAVVEQSGADMGREILENHRRSVEMQRVGAQTLSTWMSSAHLKVLDLTPLRVSKTHESLPKAQKVRASEVTSQLKNFRGTVVLVGYQQGQDDLTMAYEKLIQEPGLRVMVLDGGIEAWSAFVEGGQ